MSCSGNCVITSQVAQLDSLCTLTEREMNNCSGFQDKIFILMLFLLLYQNSCGEVSESQ